MADTKHHYSWNLYHTVTTVSLKLCGDLLICTTLIFDKQLSKELSLTLSSFSYVNISAFVGRIFALFWFPSFNAKYLNNNNKTITIIYSLFSSVLFVLFGCSYLFRQYVNVFILLFVQCVIWFFFGLSFNSYQSATIALATMHSNPNQHGQILSMLSFSWALSSLFYVLVSYLIAIHPSLPFVIFAIVMAAFAILIHFTFHFANQANVTDNDTVNTNNENISVWRNEYYRILLLATFILSIASGSNRTVLAGPLFHDIYNLHITNVGWCTLFIFFGEFVANIYMTKYSDKHGYFTTSSISFILKLLAGFLIICLSFNSEINYEIRLVVALFMIFIVYVGWEIFYISQLTALNEAISINKQNNSKRHIFLIDNAVMSVAQLVGVWGAAILWRDGNGLIYIGISLISCTLITTLLYSIYFRKIKLYKQQRVVAASIQIQLQLPQEIIPLI